ncbi:probable serine/threonine-protein kinase dyrk2 [Malaya genurostris]|uniref:probable serine/threonine-protein kinase dyrk2 n=1 Tax=Malaya genurostris TaxID=325434 RepID=UPI0026F3E445|nr:probable serine/threonine-protein kinase dyrk2 [Malaya genurostris]
MSQNIEESPLSDNKMDISETTTSQDSLPCYSPDFDANIRDGQINQNNSAAGDDVDQNTVGGEYQQQNLFDNCPNDDNDGLIREDMISTKMDNRASGSRGLTPVSNHPLMSPTGSESDTYELAYLNSNQARHYYQFPDVVPASEQPLRLANPVSNKGFMTTGVTATTTTTTTTTTRTNKTTTRCTTSTLDVINNIDNANNVIKGSILRDESPDFLSSGSEQDLSQFQASVTPAFQSVALVQSQSAQQLQHTSISPKLHQRRKIPLSTDLLVDDISSFEETVSNHSVDELQQNLVSLSPSSSILDDNGFNVDIDEDFSDVLGSPRNCASDPGVSLPQYSAREEARDIRNWQKITLPDGKTREIDMKVIEPYKRVLSHGGYLHSGGHNAIVVFSACHLPDRSRADYHYVMNNLFYYVVKTLEQLVTEDYVLIYLHGASGRGNVPPFPWLKKCYQLLDRRLRKSLKNLYMVHPTFWLKSIVCVARPFISSKFWRKLVYVKTLDELYELVPVERAAVPDKVKNYDCRHS